MPTNPDTRNPALKWLDARLGEWILEAFFPSDQPSGKEGSAEAIALTRPEIRSVIERMPGGPLLIQVPDSLAIVGSDVDREAYTQHYFASRGVARLFGIMRSQSSWWRYGRMMDTGSTEDRDALERTGQAIRAAFSNGDVEGILAYHHPDVIKALSFSNYLVGREALKADLIGTLQRFRLEFEENQVESILFQRDTAVEQTVFAIRGTPKDGGDSFVFKGRTLVVYVRSATSPTGWASIRETIQPAS